MDLDANLRSNATFAGITMMWKSLGAIALTLGCCGNSFAVATAFASSQGGTIPPPPVNIQNPVIAEATSVSGNSSASSYSNLDQGILRSQTQSYLPPSGALYEARAAASFNDTITFASGFGLTAFLDYSFEGSLGLIGNPALHSTSGQLLVNYSSFSSGSGSRNLILFHDSNGVCPFQAICSVGTSISVQGTIPILIGAGEYSLNVSLISGSQAGDSTNFANTARVYLRLPAGVTFTSGSGTFLASATPITPVPELPIWALLSFGLGALRLRKILR